MPDAVHETRIVASADDAGQRLDQWLASRDLNLSRSQVQRLIREGRVTIDGQPVKGSLLVEAGLAVDVVIPAPEKADVPRPRRSRCRSCTTMRTSWWWTSPPGMVVHPAAGHASGTLVNALLHHVTGLSGIGGQERPGVVHRLDKGTSGVMVIAKHDRAHRELAQQFHDHLVKKEYLALVWGHPTRGRTFEHAIGRDPRNRQKYFQPCQSRHGSQRPSS